MSKCKKLINLAITICLVVNLLGCNNIFKTSENQSLAECEGTTSYTEEITKEELEKINSDVNIIIQSLNDKDIEKIKTVFSGITLQEMTAFDERMEYIFDMFDGEIINTEEYGIIRLDSGSFLLPDYYSIRASYDIYTETKKYILDVRYEFQDDIQPVYAGVYSVEILDFDRTHEYYEYGNSITHKIPGVFSTEIETIEYNSNELWTYYSQREEIVPIMASAAAVELSRAGIKKIHVENLEVNDEGWMSITLVDEMNFKYFVKTDEYGYIEFIFENDADGREVFCRL